jgi:hypothetical protein
MPLGNVTCEKKDSATRQEKCKKAGEVKTRNEEARRLTNLFKSNIK